MSKLVFVISISLLFIHGCKSKGLEKWNLIETNGISEVGTHFNDIIYTSQDEGYLVGYEMIDNIGKAVIYTTNNSRDWERKEYGEGEFSKISSFNGFLYAIKTSNFYGSKVYTQNENGHFINVFNMPNYYIREFYYNNENIGYYLAKKSTSSVYNLYKEEKKGGVTKIELKNRIGATSIFDNKYFIYLSYSEASLIRPNLLIIVNLINQTEQIVDISKGYYSHCIDKNNNGDIIVTGMKGNDIAVWVLKKNEKELLFLSKLSNLSKYDFPDIIKILNDEVLLFVRGGGDVSPYRSLDGGVTWKKENISFPSYSPICFFEKNKSFSTYGYSSGIWKIQTDDKLLNQ